MNSVESQIGAAIKASEILIGLLFRIFCFILIFKVKTKLRLGSRGAAVRLLTILLVSIPAIIIIT